MKFSKRASLVTALWALSSFMVPDAAVADQPSMAVATEKCSFATSVSVEFAEENKVLYLDVNSGSLSSKPIVSATDCEESTGVSPSAIAFGTAYLTRGRPEFSATDANANFVAQVTHTSGYPVAWTFLLSNAAKAIATGPVTQANAVRTPPNCVYNKPGVSVGYFFHSSCRAHTAERAYRLNGAWVYPCQVAGHRCTATVAWTWNYQIAP